MNDQQTEQLLAFMKEEKQAVAAATGLPLPGDNQDAATLQAMFSGEGTEKLLESLETVNQQVYARAKSCRGTVGCVRQISDEPVADDAHGHGHGPEIYRAGKLGQ